MAARFELATAPPPAQPARQQSKVSAAAVWVAGGLGLAALLGGATLLLLSGPALPLIAAARQHLSGSFLGRSGFFAAFSLIFLSEVGDKTFFIAALLAMRLGRWISWCGSTASLAAMTVISVGGSVFRGFGALGVRIGQGWWSHALGIRKTVLPLLGSCTWHTQAHPGTPRHPVHCATPS